jgi:hypothetical protein
MTTTVSSTKHQRVLRQVLTGLVRPKSAESARVKPLSLFAHRASRHWGVRSQSSPRIQRGSVPMNESCHAIRPPPQRGRSVIIPLCNRQASYRADRGGAER